METTTPISRYRCNYCGWEGSHKPALCPQCKWSVYLVDCHPMAGSAEYEESRAGEDRDIAAPTRDCVVSSLSECITEISNFDGPDSPVVYRAIKALKQAQADADLLAEALAAIEGFVNDGYRASSLASVDRARAVLDKHRSQ